MQELGSFDRWKQRTALFLIGQTVSMFGSNVVQFGIVWHITVTTGSGSMLTLASLFGFLPQVLISLFSGVWADRHNRKRLIILADMLTGLTTLALAILFARGNTSIWLLMGASSIRAVGAGIQSPAVSALLPQLVPPDKLVRVNGLQGMLISVSFLLSPVASGAILALSSMAVLFSVDVFTAVIGIGLLLLLKVPPHQKATAPQTTSYIEDLKLGINYIRTDGFILRMIAFYSIFMFCAVPAIQLSALLIRRTFGPEIWRLTAENVIFSVGAIAGGLIISAWGGFKNKMVTVACSAILFGVCNILTGFVVNFFIYLAIMLLMGSCIPAFNTPSISLLQEKVDNNMQGRVFALVNMLGTAIVPLGMVMYGPLSDRMPVQYLMIGCGVVLVGLGIYAIKDPVLCPPITK